MKTDKKQTGDAGEKIAQDYLKKEGYKIKACNVSTRYGEIDIIAQKRNRLFFVEIRTRQTHTFGSALDSITKNKKNKIRKTAQSLLTTNRDWKDLIPFLSVLTIDHTQEGNRVIEFFPDAFE